MKKNLLKCWNCGREYNEFTAILETVCNRCAKNEFAHCSVCEQNLHYDDMHKVGEKETPNGMIIGICELCNFKKTYTE